MAAATRTGPAGRSSPPCLQLRRAFGPPRPSSRPWARLPVPRPGPGDLAHAASGEEAVGTQVLEGVWWAGGRITHEPQVLGPSAHLWTRTSLRPDDVDVALVYDGFTFNAISWLEALGFCGLGEAKDWLHGGGRLALDRDLPGNPHGGQPSQGRTHGFG